MSGTRTLPFKPRLSRERRRSAIEAAAAELFAERGFHAVTLEEIAARADITRATLYDHFGSKREVYVHLLAVCSREMVEYMAERVQSIQGDSEERLRQVLDVFFQFVEERPFAWRMLFREPPSDPGLAEGARAVQAAASANVAAFLRAAEPSKKRLSDRRLAIQAEALRSAQQGVAAWWYDHPEVPRADLVEGLAELFKMP